MKNLLLCVLLAVVTFVVGCGGGMAKIKGQVVENGTPLPVEGQVALMFDLLGPDGNTDPSKSYSVPLNPDGSFELVVSGGSVPPGTYKVSVLVNGEKKDKGISHYKGQSLQQEIKAGLNTLTIDLATSKP